MGIKGIMALESNTTRNTREGSSFDPSHDDLKQWFIQGLTKKDLSQQFGVSLYAITNAISAKGLDYSFELCKQDVISYVNSGIRESEIATLLNTNYTTVRKYLKKWNLSYKPEHLRAFAECDKQSRLAASRVGAHSTRVKSTEWLEGVADRVAEMYASGVSMKRIARELGISDLTVKKILVNHSNVVPESKDQRLARLRQESYQKYVDTSNPKYSLIEPSHWNDGMVPIVCDRHGTFWQLKSNHFFLGADCPKCANSGPSKAEEEIKQYIESLGLEVNASVRDMLCGSKKELDIVVDQQKLAIEYNGVFWHSSNDDSKENKTRHLWKTEQCEALGYQLLHINSNEWENPTQRTIWKSIIKSKLKLTNKIHARKTVCVDVDRNSAKKFLSDNHLQGYVNGKHVGLVYDGELVSVLSYGKTRYEVGKTEILRFATAIDYTVVGGMSKLVSHIRSNTDTELVSYANRRWSNGNSYSRCGFRMIGMTPPNYWYVKSGHMLLSRQQCQKHKLKNVLGSAFDPTLTEKQNMLNAGYRILYDSGNIKFQL